MTYGQLHNYQYNLTRILNAEFKEQLSSIDPRAYLCYQGHPQKFTVSLFCMPYKEYPIWNEVSTEHLILLSAFGVNESIEKLAHSITAFIVNQGPANDNSINTIT